MLHVLYYVVFEEILFLADLFGFISMRPINNVFSHAIISGYWQHNIKAYFSVGIPIFTVICRDNVYSANVFVSAACVFLWQMKRGWYCFLQNNPKEQRRGIVKKRGTRYSRI